MYEDRNTCLKRILGTSNSQIKSFQTKQQSRDNFQNGNSQFSRQPNTRGSRNGYRGRFSTFSNNRSTNQYKKPIPNTIICNRCQRPYHKSTQCYAKTKSNGEPLPFKQDNRPTMQAKQSNNNKFRGKNMSRGRGNIRQINEIHHNDLVVEEDNLEVFTNPAWELDDTSHINKIHHDEQDFDYQNSQSVDHMLEEELQDNGYFYDDNNDGGHYPDFDHTVEDYGQNDVNEPNSQVYEDIFQNDDEYIGQIQTLSNCNFTDFLQIDVLDLLTFVVSSFWTLNTVFNDQESHQDFSDDEIFYSTTSVFDTSCLDNSGGCLLDIEVQQITSRVELNNSNFQPLYTSSPINNEIFSDQTFYSDISDTNLVSQQNFKDELSFQDTSYEFYFNENNYVPFSYDDVLSHNDETLFHPSTGFAHGFYDNHNRYDNDDDSHDDDHDDQGQQIYLQKISPHFIVNLSSDSSVSYLPNSTADTSHDNDLSFDIISISSDQSSFNVSVDDFAQPNVQNAFGFQSSDEDYADYDIGLPRPFYGAQAPILHDENVVHWDIYQSSSGQHFAYDLTVIQQSPFLTMLFNYKNFIESQSMIHKQMFENILNKLPISTRSFVYEMAQLFLDNQHKLISLMERFGEPMSSNFKPILPANAIYIPQHYGFNSYVSPNISANFDHPNHNLSVLTEPVLLPLLQAITTKSDHNGYFPVQLQSKGSTNPLFSLILLDTGNSIHYDCALKKSMAEQIECIIIPRAMKIGLASSEHQANVHGITTFKLRFLMSDNTHKVFEMNAVVIENLSDHINISVNWLKKTMFC